MILEIELDMIEAKTVVNIIQELLESARGLAPLEQYYVLYKATLQIEKQMHEKYPNWCTVEKCNLEENENELTRIKERLEIERASKLPKN